MYHWTVVGQCSVGLLVKAGSVQPSYCTLRQQSHYGRNLCRPSTLLTSGMIGNVEHRLNCGTVGSV